MLGKSLQDFGSELAGKRGSIRAEYAYGRMLFEVVFLVAGTTEITEGANLLKNATTKLSSTLGRLKALKVLSIAKLCPTCAEFYKASQTLRANLIGTNLDATRNLLGAEFVKSGKTWEVFIKEYEALHIVPLNAFEKSEQLRFYYNNGGKLNFNSIENGIMVQKASFDGVIHANHPEYSFNLIRRIDKQFEIIQTMNKPMVEKIQFMDNELKKIIDETRKQIIEKSMKGNTKINKLFQ